MFTANIRPNVKILSVRLLTHLNR